MRTDPVISDEVLREIVADAHGYDPPQTPLVVVFLLAVCGFFTVVYAIGMLVARPHDLDAEAAARSCLPEFTPKAAGEG